MMGMVPPRIIGLRRKRRSDAPKEELVRILPDAIPGQEIEDEFYKAWLYDPCFHGSTTWSTIEQQGGGQSNRALLRLMVYIQEEIGKNKSVPPQGGDASIPVPRANEQIIAEEWR